MSFPQKLAFLSSAVALVGIVLIGQKRWQGWAVQLANQVLLVIVNIELKLWGFLPICAVCVVLYARNLRRWRADSRRGRAV